MSSESKKKVAPSQYFDASPKIDALEWRAIEEEEGLLEPGVDLGAIPICERPFFEMTVGTIIMLNAGFTALQLDFADKKKANWPWMVMDLMFASLFILELAFRIFCLGFNNFIQQKKYIFDSVLVTISIFDTVMQATGNESTGFQAFCVLRILRVFKIIKLLRITALVEDLNMIVIGLISALRSLRWVALFLALIVFLAAIVFKILVGNECDTPDFRQSFSYHFGSDIDPAEKCEEYWGTVFRCMYTLYQVTTLESWSQVIARPIWDIKPYYMIVLLGFQLLTTFGLLNIVVAAVVDGTMNSSNEYVRERKAIKETVSHLSIIRDIFEKTAGDDGQVTVEELVPLLHKETVRRKLLTMDILYDDPNQIFRILDTNSSGRCNITELTRGFMRMRGTAKSKDLLAVRALVYRCHHEHTKDMAEMKDSYSRVETVLKELRQDLRQVFTQGPSQSYIRLNDFEKPEKALHHNVGNNQIFEQIAKVRTRIDGLLSGVSTKTTVSAPPIPAPAQLQWNVSVQSSMDMPVSVTDALDETMRLEYSKQLQQLQSEFQTLQRWLDLVPQGLQAQGASKKMQDRFKGDMPLGEECVAADGFPLAGTALFQEDSHLGLKAVQTGSSWRTGTAGNKDKDLGFSKSLNQLAGFTDKS